MSQEESRPALTRGQLDINVILACALGFIFLVTILVMASFFQNPSEMQVKAFNVTLALAAGGIGAAIPGTLTIQHKAVIRAGGAIALVVLVLYYSPQLTSSTVKLVEPAESPEPTALKYLGLIDQSKIAEAWAMMDSDAGKQHIGSLGEWEKIYDAYRKPLGAVGIRQLTGISSLESPPGFPVGLYRVMVFRTRFSADVQCRAEQVTLRAAQDLSWKITGYMISPMFIPCV